MKIHVIINGVLEVQFEREAKLADWPTDEHTIKFFKACIQAASEEARKLCPPNVPDNGRPNTDN